MDYLFQHIFKWTESLAAQAGLLRSLNNFLLRSLNHFFSSFQLIWEKNMKIKHSYSCLWTHTLRVACGKSAALLCISGLWDTWSVRLTAFRMQHLVEEVLRFVGKSHSGMRVEKEVVKVKERSSRDINTASIYEFSVQPLFSAHLLWAKP